MGKIDASPPSSSSYTKRLSGVPAEFVKQHLVGSPTGAKLFADSVDGAKQEIIPVKCDIILKGFKKDIEPKIRSFYEILN